MDDRELFILYRDKSTDLRQRKIWDNGGLKYHVFMNTMTFTSKPDEELFRSFLMDLRLFVMEQEVTSFLYVRGRVGYRLRSGLVSEANMLKKMKSMWSYAMMDGSFKVGTFGGRNFTPKEVLDTFLYGQYFHIKDHHKEVLEEDSQSSMIQMKQMLLYTTIEWLCVAIFDLGKFIRYGLEHDWFDFDKKLIR